MNSLSLIFILGAVGFGVSAAIDRNTQAVIQHAQAQIVANDIALQTLRLKTTPKE